MRKLGVSIYPEKTTMEKDKQYIDLAVKYGFQRVFTCLLSAEGDIEEIKKIYKEIIKYCTDRGMEVILDVAPNIFQKLNISYDDLTFFKELGATGIRLDIGFDGLKEANMSFNNLDLDIELNMSNDTYYLENILSHTARKDKIIGCHNFYPQVFTGLSYDYFIKCSKRFKENNIRTAAFVSTSCGEIGPWSINDGLCTLEEHRNLNITTAAKHLWATGLIDDVIIGNAYASEDELKGLGELNRYLVELDIYLEENISDVEKSIINELHVRRGDINDYMIRSTEIRKKHINSEISILDGNEQKTGDVMIGNNSFGKYKGELQVILKDIPKDKRKNKVAVVAEEELFLLNYVGAWSKFKLKVRD